MDDAGARPLMAIHAPVEIRISSVRKPGRNFGLPALDACDGDNAPRCLNAGYISASCEKDLQRKEKGLRLFEKACDAGSAHGCRSAGRMYSAGEGVMTDPVKALVLLEKACGGGDKKGCSEAKRLRGR